MHPARAMLQLIFVASPKILHHRAMGLRRQVTSDP
jgi:hypothetical protein